MPSLATVSPTRGATADDADQEEEDDGSEEIRSRTKRKRPLNGGNGNRHDEEDDGSEADDDAGAESKNDDRYRAKKVVHPTQAKSPSKSHTQSGAADEQQFDFKMLPDPTAAPHKQLPLLPKPFLRTKPTVKVRGSEKSALWDRARSSSRRFSVCVLFGYRWPRSRSTSARSSTSI